MANNDPLKSVENIVQLQNARRANPVPALQTPRAQPMPPVFFASWVAARDKAAASLLGGTKRLLLTGPAGTGKTVLVEHVARVLRAAGRTVIVQLADADPEPPGPGLTLFVDEADRLSAAKLRQLFDEAAGTVVLIGLAPLGRRVTSGTVQLTLDSLGPIEARDYIAQWLTLNGRTSAELDSKAVRALFELSGGVPRLLSTLLAAGSWLAKSGDARVIEAVHIQEAAELRSVLGPSSSPDRAIVTGMPPRRRVLWSTLLTSVVLVGAAVAIAPRLFPAESDRAAALAAPFLQQAERWLRAEPAVQQRPRTERAPAPISEAPALPAPIEAAPPPAEPVPAAEPPKPVAEAPAPEPAPAMPEPAPPVPEATQPAPAPPLPEPVQAAPEPPQSLAVPEVKQPDPTPQEAQIPAPAPVQALPVAPPVVAPPPSLPVETIDFLLRRGRDMLAIGDISAARLLFQRAAEGGSAEAMFELGQTFDPAILTGIGAAAQADRAEALRWYRLAAAKGNHAAERHLPKP